MPRTTTGWRPRQSHWNARDLFSHLRSEDIALGAAERENLRSFFWFDLCAEWDAQHLHRLLQDRRPVFSDDFLAFEEAWYEDEINHAEGFLRLYSLLYDESETDIRVRLANREPDFGPIASFLDDEFDLALLFAYDELATMRAYRIDMLLYARFRLPAAMTWIRRLLRDETYHHKNGFDLVLRHHAHRLDEVDDRIDDFLDHDETDRRYRATFLFDHEWAHIKPDFFARTAQVLKGAFRRARSRRP
ncbi:MAG: hypothetical protein H6807_02385 [Planctomycetes bacterium]|nr:hypothetical protein [Planctomycetota bacterium]